MSGNNLRALLIETEDADRVTIEACLRIGGCEVRSVQCPEQAFGLLERNSFSLIVWGVPRTHPDRPQVISELRLRSEAPLVLVDGDAGMAQLDLEMGADQWLPKPYVPGALVGSVKAALRTSAGTSHLPPLLKVDIRGMLLDGGRRTLTFSGRRVAFTRQEWQLLAILVSHPDRFLSAREILSLGWRAGDHEAEQLRTYVHRLRLKLGPLNLSCHLVSQHGQGYALLFPEQPSR
jgi:DNA-binding response OmpR family regulator